MNGLKVSFIAGMLFIIAACDHPIRIVGQGDVMSASGERNCLLEQFQASATNCTKNTVVTAYTETYYAVPRNGWMFSGWRNYCEDITDPNMTDCSFDIPGGAVFDAWGQTMPPLVAVFTEGQDSPPDDWALEGSTASYSATRTLQSSEGTFTMQEWAEPNKTRIEMIVAGQSVAFINREDLNVAWQLFLTQKIYSEISLSQFADQAADDLKVLSYSKVGSETISGILTDKYRIVADDSEGNRVEGFYWVSRSGILVKTEAMVDDGQETFSFIMTLTDIVEGNQPDSLFEVPANFTELPSLPPGLPGLPAL